MEIPFKVGTMIEIPRAALTANRIASRAEYFSFGTNDLTQMTFGYSRRRYRFILAGISGKEDSESRPVPSTRSKWCRSAD